MVRIVVTSSAVLAAVVFSGCSAMSQDSAELAALKKGVASRSTAVVLTGAAATAFAQTLLIPMHGGRRAAGVDSGANNPLSIVGQATSVTCAGSTQVLGVIAANPSGAAVINPDEGRMPSSGARSASTGSTVNGPRLVVAPYGSTTVRDYVTSAFQGTATGTTVYTYYCAAESAGIAICEDGAATGPVAGGPGAPVSAPNPNDRANNGAVGAKGEGEPGTVAGGDGANSLRHDNKGCSCERAELTGGVLTGYGIIDQPNVGEVREVNGNYTGYSGTEQDILQADCLVACVPGSHALVNGESGPEDITCGDDGHGAYWEAELIHNCDKCALRVLGTHDKDLGCVARGTAVELATHQTKLVEQLKAGDRVWNPLKRRGYVIQEVTHGGQLHGMLRVSTGTQTVVVNSVHPMWTERGLVTAQQLKKNDVLRDAKGKKMKVTKIESLEGAPSDVFNVILDAPASDTQAHLFVTDGVVTGDLVLQRQLVDKLH